MEPLSHARVSTGLAVLDDVLGGLFWGDNVVWLRDRAPVEPFYRAIAAQPGVFDTRTVVSLGTAVNTYGVPGLAILDAGSGSRLPQPGDLLQEVRRHCTARRRRLLLFESLDGMVRAWGPHGAREFFARCGPLLLEAGAVGYWTMRARETPAQVQEAVRATAQCVLRVDARSIRVDRAEARHGAVAGSVLPWREDAGRLVVSPPEITGRVAASLRGLRRARRLSQHDVGDLAGVSASAISQAERAERGLSLATVARLSAALGVTIDDLVRGQDPAVYLIGRRTEDPRGSLEGTCTLLGDPGSDLRIDLVHLEAREAREPARGLAGLGIVAVAEGLLQVTVAGRRAVLRHGEVLVADGERIERVRNLGHTGAVLFLIAVARRGLNGHPGDAARSGG